MNSAESSEFLQIQRNFVFLSFRSDWYSRRILALFPFGSIEAALVLVRKLLCELDCRSLFTMIVSSRCWRFLRARNQKWESYLFFVANSIIYALLLIRLQRKRREQCKKSIEWKWLVNIKKKKNNKIHNEIYSDSVALFL